MNISNGINEPTEIQELSIVPIINAKNVIAKSPYRFNQIISFITGILQRISSTIEDNQRALVVTTTKAQATKISLLFNEIGAFIPELKISRLRNPTSLDQQQIDEVNQSRILISTHKHALQWAQNESTDLSNINIICVSESDQLFSDELYTDTKEIIEKLQSGAQIIAFTTSITNDILDKMESIIPNPVKICVNNEPIKLKNVKQFYVEPSSTKNQFSQLYDLCSSFHLREVIVVAQNKRSAEYFHQKFEQRYLDFPLIHHEMNKEMQEKILDQFFNIKKRGVLISDFLPKINSQYVIIIFANMPYKMPKVYADNIILCNNKDLQYVKNIKKLPQKYLQFFIDYERPENKHFKNFCIDNDNQQQMIDNLIFVLNLLKDCKVVIYANDIDMIHIIYNELENANLESLIISYQSNSEKIINATIIQFITSSTNILITNTDDIKLEYQELVYINFEFPPSVNQYIERMNEKDAFINIINKNKEMRKKFTLSQFYHTKMMKFPFNFKYDMIDDKIGKYNSGRGFVTNFESKYEKIIVFEQINFKKEVLEGLLDSGFINPTYIQLLSIEPIIERRNIIAESPFWQCQIVAYAAGILERINVNEMSIQAIILTPTNENAFKIFQIFKQISIYMKEIQIEILTNDFSIESLKNKISKLPHVVIATPCIVAKFINNIMKCDKTSIICFDHVDELFNNEYDSIVYFICKNINPKIQFLAYSTIIQPSILNILDQLIIDPVKVFTEKLRTFLHQYNFQHYFIEENDENSKLSHLADICCQLTKQKIIIFTNTKDNISSVGTFLNKANFDTICINDFKANIIEKSLKKFIEGTTNILISLNVILNENYYDFSQVSIIINFDLPDPNYYYSRFVCKGFIINFCKSISQITEIENHCEIKIEKLPLNFADIMGSNDIYKNEIPKVEEIIIDSGNLNITVPKNLHINENLLRGVKQHNFHLDDFVLLLVEQISNGRSIIAANPNKIKQIVSFVIGILESINEKEKTTQALILTQSKQHAYQIFNLFSLIAAYAPYYSFYLLDDYPQEPKFHPHVAISTPKFALDVIKKGYLQSENIKIVCIYQADELLYEGLLEEEVIPNIFKLMQPKVQILSFISFFDKEYVDNFQYIKDPIKIHVEQKQPWLDNFDQRYIKVATDENKLMSLLDFYSHSHYKNAIIYANDKKTVKSIQDAFSKEKLYKIGQENKVSFATDVFKEVTNINDVDLIINFNVPITFDIYLKRLGYPSNINSKKTVINICDSFEMDYLNKIENFFHIEIPQYINEPMKSKSSTSQPKPTPPSTPNVIKQEIKIDISKLLPPFKKYMKNNIKFLEFKPIKNLFYFFFSDNNEPTTSIITRKYYSLFSIGNASDIQRFRYYPGTQNIYTFIGFSDEDKLNKSMTNQQFITAINFTKIYKYPYVTLSKPNEPPTSNNINKSTTDPNPSTTTTPTSNTNINNNEEKRDISSFLPPFKKYMKNDIKFLEFKPIKNLFYFFFSDNNEPTPSVITRKYYSLFTIQSASDIQRFRYYPGTQNIYTFIGFSDEDKLNKSMTNQQFITAINFTKIYKYPYVTLSKPNEPSTSNNINKSTTDPNPSTTTTPTSNTNINNNEEKRDISSFLPPFKKYMKNDIKFLEFKPIKNLFYFFFSDNNEPTTSIITRKYYTLFSIGNASDIQRFRYYPGTQNIYTFIGFSDEDKLNKSMTNQQFITAINFTKIYKYPYVTLSKPNEPPTSNNINKSTTDPNSSTTTTPTSSININSKEDSNNNNISKTSINEEKRDISSFLPPFKKYMKNDIKFLEFKPIKNLFYLFFSDNNEPTTSVITRKYYSLFTIQSASDIQRFRYYPGTQNIYTFIGFSDEDKLNKSMTNQKFITAINFTKIYKYPYSNSSEENNPSTSNAPKPTTPNEPITTHPPPSTSNVIKPENDNDNDDDDDDDDDDVDDNYATFIGDDSD